MIYICPTEGISTPRSHEDTCPKPTSTRSTNSVPPVFDSPPNSVRERLPQERDIDIEPKYRSISSSSSLHSQNNNQQKKKEKATANRTRLVRVYAAGVDKGVGTTRVGANRDWVARVGLGRGTGVRA